MTNINDLNEQNHNNYYGFIYITTNKITGKQYIGQRKYYGNHEEYLGSGHLIKAAIKEYGKENFSRLILEKCYTRKELNEKEKYWISLFNASESEEFYNIALGGEGGGLAGEKAPNYGKHMSIETREKIRLSQMGASNSFYGRHHSEETRNKLAQYATGKKHTDDEKRRMSINMRKNHADYNGSKNPRAKKTNQYTLSGELIKTWDCAKDAANVLGLNYVSITQCCRGIYKSSGGYIWKYT